MASKSVLSDRAAYLMERLGTSLWPIPVAISLFSVLLALLMLWLDRHFAVTGLDQSLFALEPQAARQVLGVVAGSIIGVGGVAFSVTMVALTLTSGQYGPKVLRSFLDDTLSKVVLGVFVGTYLYGLIILAMFGTVDHPPFTVLCAIVLAFAALLGFVQFIHRAATDLQADQIVQRIGRRLRHTMTQLGAEAERRRRTADTLRWRAAARGRRAQAVASTRRGYVQSIDYRGLADWCAKHDALLLVRARAGDLLVPGASMFRLYRTNPGDQQQVVEALNEKILVGPMRTPLQDVEYAVTQLNQLAARALSPGVNDPGSAISCIDWFSVALADLVDRDVPGCVFLDRRQRPRLLVRGPDFAGIMKAIYAPLRQYADTDVAVSARLLESLCRLAELTRRTDRLRILAMHGQLVVDGFNRQPLPDYDARDLRRRYRRLQRLVHAAVNAAPG